MMTRLQYLLTKLSEECSEVAQQSLKCQQFGFEAVKPNQDKEFPLNNRELLIGEINDLNAIIELLNHEFNLGYEVNSNNNILARVRKMNKVQKFYEISVGNNLVEREEKL